MVLCVFNNLVNCCECHRNAGVSTTIVDCDSACVSIAESCAGECNVLNVTDAFVCFTGIEKVFRATILNDPGLVDVEDASAKAVNKAVAAFENAVVEY